MDEASEERRTYLVEHYWPGVTVDDFRAAADRVRASSAELARAGVVIDFLHSTLVPEDEAAFCVFAAESPEPVEDAYRRAAVPFERIVDAHEIEHTSHPASAERQAKDGMTRDTVPSTEGGRDLLSSSAESDPRRFITVELEEAADDDRNGT